MELLKLRYATGKAFLAKGWWVIVDTPNNGPVLKHLWEQEEAPNFQDLAQAIKGIAEKTEDLNLVLEIAKLDPVLVRRG